MIANISHPFSPPQYNSRWSLPQVEQTGSISSININPFFPKNILTGNSKNTAPKQDSKAFDALNTAWQKEYVHNQNYLKGDLKIIQKATMAAIGELARLKFDDVEIEISPRNAVKYMFILPDKKLLIITQSFDDFRDKPKDSVVFSIFQNKELIVSDTKNLYELVSNLNEFFSV